MLNLINPTLRQTPGCAPAQAEPLLYLSYSVPWPQTSLLDFLQCGANAPRIYWETGKNTPSLAGFGVAAMLTARDDNRFEAIQQQAAALFSRIVRLNADAPAVAGPRLFGGFAFNPQPPTDELWSAFPAARFILPQYQLTRFDNQTWLTINHCAGSEAERDAIVQHLPQEISQLHAALLAGQPAAATPAQPQTAGNVMPPETWHQLVAEAVRRIRGGQLDKVVLARARRLSFAAPTDPTTALARLAERYPDTYRFLMEPVPGHAFFGATPELLAEVDGPTLRTVAMAGSIRRGGTPAEDDDLAQQLLANPKERQEHALVVEAIQENLAGLTTHLHVPAVPTICRLSNIQHLQTKIQGRLAHQLGILPVVKALHPTPAVGGRPRAIALNIINTVEPTARGWYAAPVGWLDERGNGLFAVAIRSAVSVGSDSMLFAGAGIVADSVPETEWRETELKFRPLAEALGAEAANGRA